MSNKLVMVDWLFSSMYFIDFTIHNIKIGEIAFMYPEEDFPPQLPVTQPVMNTVSKTELVNLIHMNFAFLFVP